MAKKSIHISIFLHVLYLFINNYYIELNFLPNWEIEIKIRTWSESVRGGPKLKIGYTPVPDDFMKEVSKSIWFYMFDPIFGENGYRPK